MSFLITGGTGFVGQYCIQALKKLGRDQICLVRKKNSATDLGNQIEVDLTDRLATLKVLRSLKPEYIIHLAGDRQLRKEDLDNNLEFDTNFVMARNLLESSLDNSELKLFLSLGTCDEYGLAEPPFVESQIEMPNSQYGFGKFSFTNLIREKNQNAGFPGLVLRPSVIYGPRQQNDMFLPALINSLLRDEKFSMTDGNQTRDYIFVEDVVAAILKTLTLKNIPTTPIFNLGSGCSVTIKELAIKVSNIIGGDRRNLLGFGEKSHLPNALMKYQVNIQKASTMLNWRPQTLINDGLKLTIDYIKKSLK